ncbi:MAG TPA: tetratricopeptide repeat protein [Desulfobacterales bacterium]|nr:tetratricopeptide repeat protein [Desulfobacterales bacterium]
MFNAVIYFIVVLLTFSLSYPEEPSPITLADAFSLFLAGCLLLALCGRVWFRGIERALSSANAPEGVITRQYHAIVTRLSIMGVVLFFFDAFFLNLKYWVEMVPFLGKLSLFQGVVAAAIFFLYLSIIWFFSYASYREIFSAPFSRQSYIFYQIQFHFPVLFPWLALSATTDLIGAMPFSGIRSFLNSGEGQLIYFTSFMLILMTFMPKWIQKWWRCKPLPRGQKTEAIREFLDSHGLKYRDLLRWPIFEGKVLTAGIMGIVARFRYILLTDALLEILSVEELKAVLAHEMAHAKYKHLLFYILFFGGFVVISYGLLDFLFYTIAAHPYFLKILMHPRPGQMNTLYLTMTLPMLLILIIYFRFIMGFFMRHFERQADLYSAFVMRTSRYTIDALEKIALLGGKIRDMPSWHHFSIKQRVEALIRAERDPLFRKRHNTFLALTILLFISFLIGVGWFVNFSQIKRGAADQFLTKVIEQRLAEEPNNVDLLTALAMIHHRRKRLEEALNTYERLLEIAPNHTVALNNLAWLLVVEAPEGLRDVRRALRLAQRAVELEKSSVVLDTLAEAYFANGMVAQAIETAREALSLAPKEGRQYYENQLKKFLSHGRVSP